MGGHVLSARRPVGWGVSDVQGLEAVIARIYDVLAIFAWSAGGREKKSVILSACDVGKNGRADFAVVERRKKVW